MPINGLTKQKNWNKHMISRRDFLGCSAAAFASLMAPQVFARPRALAEKSLRFYNIHTGEKLSATYWAEGQYQAEALEAINRIMRDHRSREITNMDLRLLDVLQELQATTGKSGHYEIISAYRSPASNKLLRKNGSGVAKRSLHMRGKAIDIRLPGVELKHLRQAALKLHAGGVGYYPDSNFIHVDTGRPRFW